MKKLLFFFIFSLFFIFPPITSASSDFSTKYNVRYTVSENENTHVQINVTLSNKTDIYYASSYKIHAGFTDIKNTKATDSLGNILTGVSRKDDEQVINVTFNERVTGLGNKLNFTISFDTLNVAKKVGNIWEINIPGLSSTSDVSDFSAQVVVPKSFGAATFIKPSVKSQSLSTIYNFTKDDLGSSGISITFGNTQIYKFNLVYHLYNKNLFPVKTEIALPPSTNYQDVQIDKINIPPENVHLDQDGNWLAQYYLSPSQKKDIIVDAKVKVRLSPSQQPEPEEKLKAYLKKNEYWETDNREIKDKAQSLKTPYDVYNFVSSYLKYDYSRVTSDKPRLGGAQTLSHPSSAVCLEFTDLFITLARASGIPAREVDGYAYTQNSKERPLSLIKDVLHAWPQYYDREKKTWVMVDPTWGNTTGGLDYFNTLDFDHIAFVIKGQDSTYPVPAGGYKLPGGQSQKDITVTFDENFESSGNTYKITSNLPKNLTSGFSSKGNIQIKNSGKTITSAQKVLLKSEILTPNIQSFYINQIPPYGNVTIPIAFDKTPALTKGKDRVKITIGGNELVHTVELTPLYLNIWVAGGGAIILGGSIVIISLVAVKPRNLSFFRQKGQDSLRRKGEKP